jgi:hypothetical protein
VFKRVGALIVLASIFLALPAAAQANPCIVAAPATGVQRITIDARSGQVVSPATRFFARSTTAEVVVINKNPFRYEYTVDVAATPVAEPGLAAFLPFIAPFQIDPTPADPPAEEEEDGQSQADVAETDDIDCPIRDALRERHETLLEDRKDLVEDIDGAAREIKKTTAEYNGLKATLESANAVCDTLYRTSTDAVTKIDVFLKRVDLDALSEAIDALEEEAEAQQKALKTYRTKKDKESGCRLDADELAAMSDRAELYADEVVEKMRANIAKLTTARQTLKNARDTIQTVLDGGPPSFTQFINVGPFDESNDVLITVKRKELKPDATLAVVGSPVKFSFGGPALFTLAGGLAGSSIDRVQYQRVQGFETNADKELVATTVVGEKEDSSSRVTPLLILHGRLYDRPAMLPVSVQFSVGVSAKADNVGVDVEYLVGPSIGLLDNKLFITIGAYGGRVQTLEGGFEVGDKVPADIAEIPVQKDLRWALGFAATYKLR